MRGLSKILLAGFALVGAGLIGVIALGTSAPSPELKSVSSPFAKVDFSDLPPIRKLEVRHGSPVAYRQYGTGTKGVVIAIHGSTGTSASLHPLARAIAADGYAVYAPDLRGHGETGRRGDVDFIGQPDMDLLALKLQTSTDFPGKKVTLLGFSLGGGFVLRFVGAYTNLQPDKTVLLAPALGSGAPTMRTTGDSWASPHVPRIIALTVLNRLGFHALDGLEAIAYAVPAGLDQRQTRRYSFRLYRSLMPSDYKTSLAAITSPLHILIGEKDELFDAAKMQAAFPPTIKNVDVTIVPGVDHIGITLDAAALPAILDKIATKTP